MKTRYFPLAAMAVAALALPLRGASGQTYYGTDIGGSATTKAPNVNSAAARASFLSVLSGVGTEDFETRSGSAPLALSFIGAGTATLTGTGSIQSYAGAGANGAGRYATSGTKWWEARITTSGNFKVGFSSAVAAFGFYGIDIGDFGSQLSLVFDLVGGGTDTWLLPYVATNGTNTARDGSLLYAGYVNTTGFTGVTFVGTTTDDAFAFDDMTVGSRESVTGVVPEPASIALVATGLLGMLAVARRRRA